MKHGRLNLKDTLTPSQRVALLFMINALLKQIHPNELTKKVDKLSTQVSKAILLVRKTNSHVYAEGGKLADNAWENAKKEIDDKNYQIILSASLTSLYDLFDKCPWFTSKTFESAIRSIESDIKNEDYDEVEVVSNSLKLSDIFAKHLNISKSNKLALKKKIISQNLVLEGKI